MNPIQTFTYQSSTVRTVERDGEPASGICKNACAHPARRRQSAKLSPS